MLAQLPSAAYPAVISEDEGGSNWGVPHSSTNPDGDSLTAWLSGHCPLVLLDGTSSSSGSDSWPSKYSTVVLEPLGDSENMFVGIMLLAVSLRVFVRVRGR